MSDSGKSSSTIRQALAAISAMHRRAGEADPTHAELVRTAHAGARREIGTAPHKKAAATVDIVKELVSGLDRSTLQGKRDAAILLLASAARSAAPSLSRWTPKISRKRRTAGALPIW